MFGMGRKPRSHAATQPRRGRAAAAHSAALAFGIQRRPRGADATLGRPAFSLAELMIALAILAMGLLVIGAALPVGARYTQQSVNMATGEAAAEYALDLIEQSVSLPRRIYDPNGAGRFTRAPGLFQPRFPYTSPTDPNNGLFDPTYEPIIKVRPLWTQNVNTRPGATFGQEYDTSTWGALVEYSIENWLVGKGVPADDKKESDPKWVKPALPSVAMVYPPVPADTPWLPANFFAAPYAQLPVATPPSGAETLKVLDQRVVWTAFYRRVAYPDVNDPNKFSDPALYEVIVVVSRLPSSRHRFPVQDPTAVGKAGTQHSSTLGAVSGASTYDCAAPMPWLISFTNLPRPANGFDPATGFPRQPWQAPATLTFTCNTGRSGLLPVGAIFIPARNDLVPSYPALAAALRVGFSPPSPDALPLFEVVQRPDDTTVIATFNGFYPMQGTVGSYKPVIQASDWPVWVIPPAYEDLDTSVSPPQPIMPDRSPIVAVARRYMHLREIP